MAIAASTISSTQTLEEFRLEFNKLQSDVSTLESNPTYGTSITFEGATADAYEPTLAVTDPTADRTITLPNATGTVLLSDAVNPASADGGSLGTTSLEWSDLYLADGGIVYFGDDQDITLTHAADASLAVGGAGGTTGLIINNTAADGDPFLAFALSGTQTFTMGVDDGDSDKFKIGTTAIGTSTAFAMDSSGNVTITGDLTVTGDDLYMNTNTSGYVLVADGTNYNPVAVSGDVTISTAGAVTIASTSVEGSMLNNNVVSGLTALTSGLATTDELLISDGGTIKRMDISVLLTLTDGNATAFAVALG